MMKKVTQKDPNAALVSKIKLLIDSTVKGKTEAFTQVRTFSGMPDVTFMTVNLGNIDSKSARFLSPAHRPMFNEWLDKPTVYAAAKLLGRQVRLNKIKGMCHCIYRYGKKWFVHIDDGSVHTQMVNPSQVEKSAVTHPLSRLDAQLPLKDVVGVGLELQSHILALCDIHPDYHILHVHDPATASQHEIMLVKKGKTSMDDMLSQPYLPDHADVRRKVIRNIGNWLRVCEMYFSDTEWMPHILGALIDNSYNMPVYCVGLNSVFGEYREENIVGVRSDGVFSTYNAYLSQIRRDGLLNLMPALAMFAQQKHKEWLDASLRVVIGESARAALIANALF